MDFAGGFINLGESCPIEEQMDRFLKEAVEFDNMPSGVKTWK